MVQAELNNRAWISILPGSVESLRSERELDWLLLLLNARLCLSVRAYEEAELLYWYAHTHAHTYYTVNGKSKQKKSKEFQTGSPTALGGNDSLGVAKAAKAGRIRPLLHALVISMKGECCFCC